MRPSLPSVCVRAAAAAALSFAFARPVRAAGSDFAASIAMGTTTISVNIEAEEIIMATMTDAGPTRFVISNKTNTDVDFHLEGPGVSESIAAPLGAGQSTSLETVLKAGRYHVTAGPEKTKSDRNAVDLTVRPSKRQEAAAPMDEVPATPSASPRPASKPTRRPHPRVKPTPSPRGSGDESPSMPDLTKPSRSGGGGVEGGNGSDSGHGSVAPGNDPNQNTPYREQPQPNIRPGAAPTPSAAPRPDVY